MASCRVIVLFAETGPQGPASAREALELRTLSVEVASGLEPNEFVQFDGRGFFAANSIFPLARRTEHRP